MVSSTAFIGTAVPADEVNLGADRVVKFIHEQPAAFANVLSDRSVYTDGLPKSFSNIVLIGSGSSLTAVQMALSYFRQACNFTIEVNPKAFLDRPGEYTMTENTLCFVLSQSGKSTDTIDAARLAISRGAWVIAMTGNGSSPLAKVKGLKVVQLPIGHEDVTGVVLGPTVTAMVLCILAKVIRGNKIKITPQQAESELQRAIDFYPQFMQKINLNNVNDCTSIHLTAERHMFGAVNEGGLKVIEMAGKSVIKLITEEFSHGQTHGVSTSDFLMMVATTLKELEAARRNQIGLATKGVTNVYILVLLPEQNKPIVTEGKEVWFPTEIFDIDLRPFMVTILLQLLAVDLAKLNSINPAKLVYPGMFKYLGTKTSHPVKCEEVTSQELAMILGQLPIKAIRILADFDGTLVSSNPASTVPLSQSKCDAVCATITEVSKVCNIYMNTGRLYETFKNLLCSKWPAPLGSFAHGRTICMEADNINEKEMHDVIEVTKALETWLETQGLSNNVNLVITKEGVPEVYYDNIPDLGPKIEAMMKQLISDNPNLEVISGADNSYEYVAVGFDKGKSVEKINAVNPGVVVTFGDAESDEAAYVAALRTAIIFGGKLFKGFGVRVGPPVTSTKARFWIKNPEALRDALSLFAQGKKN